ncbi:chemotaxis protein CheX [Niallia sp. XMNu-256]|uniref:chemotaxis protein CheX n=1 Tax=Niallia sp. XMNu-256 TaxID=3082444 RepID=UPI0030CEAD60
MEVSIIKQVTDIISSTIDSIKGVFPFGLLIDDSYILQQPYTQQSIGVLIGMTGDLSGRLIIDGDETVFTSIGEVMFGMKVEGEMLKSFAGELGNMIAGTLSTAIARHKIEMDITPPTVLVGETKIYGFEKAFCLQVIIQNIGNLTILLMIEQQ